MKLYDELASWWPLVSHPDDYVEEARDAVETLRAAARRPVREVLELGSGGGNNASHMKRELALTLVEPSAAMREVSGALNPECLHVAGDMRSVRLDRRFDAVFVHDAVMYMRSEGDLAAAIATAAHHVRPDGAVLILPDATLETFVPRAELHGGDERVAPGMPARSLRYLEWSLPPLAGATSFFTHFALLLKERDGSVRSVHDVHEEGLFPRATWLRLLSDAGLEPRLSSRVIDGIAYDTLVAVRTA